MSFLAKLNSSAFFLLSFLSRQGHGVARCSTAWTGHYLHFRSFQAIVRTGADGEITHNTCTEKEQRGRYPPNPTSLGGFQVSMFLAQGYTTAWLETVSAYTQHFFVSDPPATIAAR